VLVAEAAVRVATAPARWGYRWGARRHGWAIGCLLAFLSPFVWLAGFLAVGRLVFTVDPHAGPGTWLVAEVAWSVSLLVVMVVAAVLLARQGAALRAVSARFSAITGAVDGRRQPKPVTIRRDGSVAVPLGMNIGDGVLARLDVDGPRILAAVQPGAEWRMTYWPPALVVFAVASPVPATSLPAALLPDEGGSVFPTRQLRVGVGRDGPVWWDTRRFPHLLVAGRTGAGKTRALEALISAALAAGFEVLVVDPKRFDLLGFAGHRGVLDVATDGPTATAVLARARAEVAARTERYEADVWARRSVPTFRPWLVVVDEVTELVEVTGGRRSSAVADIGSLMRLGRGLNVHVAVATQRPDVKESLPGSIQDQAEARLVLGHLGTTGAHMVLRDPSLDLPPGTPPGRGRLLAGQVYDVRVDLVADDQRPRPIAAPTSGAQERPDEPQQPAEPHGEPARPASESGRASQLVPPVVVGVDSGRSVGVAVRRAAAALDATTIRRADGESEEAHHGRVVAMVRTMVETHGAALVAVEGVVLDGARGPVRSRLLATQRVVDAVCAEWPDAVVVPPAAGREGCEGAPAELCRERPRGFTEADPGVSDRKHERAAWVVAGEATQDRQEALA
jgi:hypothetical protein